MGAGVSCPKAQVPAQWEGGTEAELLHGEVLSTPGPALDPRGLHFISVELRSGSQSGDENIREISTSETA